MPDDGETKTTFETKDISYTATGADEDFIVFTDLKDKVILHINTTNFTDPTTIKIKETINGVDDLILSISEFSTSPTSTYAPGVTSIAFILDGSGENVRVTLDSVAASAVNIGTNTRTEVRL